MARHSIMYTAVVGILIHSTSVNAQQSDRAAWIANASERIQQADKWEYVSYFGSLLQSYKNHPTEGPFVSPKSAYRTKVAIDTRDNPAANGAYRNPVTERANRVYEALKEGGPLPYFIGDHLQYKLKQSTVNDELDLAMVGNRRSWEAYRTYAPQLQTILGELYDLAKQRPEVKESINEVYGRFFGASFDDTFNAIIRSNPNLTSNAEISAALSAGSLSPEKLREIIEAALTKKLEDIPALRNDIQALLKRTDLSNRGDNDQQSNITELTKSASDAEYKFAQAELEVQALRSAGLLLEAVLPDKKSAREVSATINAVASFHHALSSYKRSLAAFSSDGTAATLSSVILAGNLLSAGLQLQAAFQKQDGPTTSQLILQGLQKLSSQIEDFRLEMHSRFDRIDSALNEIYREIALGFSSVSRAISVVSDQNRSTQFRLDLIAGQIDSFERRLDGKLDHLIDQRFREQMVACLEHDKVSNEKMAIGKFSDCVGYIRSYLKDAYRPVHVVHWEQFQQNRATLLGNVRKASWDQLGGIIQGLANEAAGTQTTGPRANPIRWMVASRAFTTLATNNIEPFRLSPSDTLQDLIREGDSHIREFSFNLAAGARDKSLKLFDRILEMHSSAARRVEAVAQKVRADHLRAEGAFIQDLAVTIPVQQMLSVSAQTDPLWSGRSVSHIKRDDPSFPPLLKKNLNDLFRDSYPVPIAGDETWPDLGHHDLWKQVSANYCLAPLELLGAGRIELSYLSQYVRPHYRWIDGLGAGRAIGHPSLAVRVHFKDKRGNRFYLGEKASNSLFPVQFFYSGTGGSIPVELGLMSSFDFKKDLSSNSPRVVVDLSHVGCEGHGQEDQPTGLDLVNLRRSELAINLQDRLRNEAAAAASELASAIQDLDAALNLLRATVLYLFPSAFESDEQLRFLLYGTVGRDAQVVKNVRERPLLSARLIDDYLHSRLPEPGSPGSMKLHELVSASVILGDLATTNEGAARSFMANIHSALDRTREQLDVNPAISFELSRLYDLDHLRKLNN